MSVFTPSRILVPTDYSEPALNALRYACTMAERFGGRIVLMYADMFVPAVDFTATPAGEFEFTRTRMIEDEKDRLEAYAKVNVSPSVRYETCVTINEPVEAIVDASQSGCDLVVMGTHGRTGMNRMMFGSVTAAVMRAAAVPVLAVNGESKPKKSIRRILCPVTFTSACREALRYAAGLTVGPIVLLRGASNQPLRNAIDESMALYDWVPPELESRCEVSVIPASATAEEIVKFAKLNDVDLIALAVAADRRLADVLHGTIAEKVVQRSSCPVLTVNPKAAEADAIREIAQELPQPA